MYWMISVRHYNPLVRAAFLTSGAAPGLLLLSARAFPAWRILPRIPITRRMRPIKSSRGIRRSKPIGKTGSTASSSISRCTRQDPTGPWAAAGLFMSGKLYYEMGIRSGLSSDMKEAVDHYERILKRFPESKYKSRAQKELQAISKRTGTKL